ncbi:MAG TPA: hypothetical protein VK447_05765, partial [Myxococcaceae bacterium]|nr:hypothetical protein [Myxococcaceae bacterium]
YFSARRARGEVLEYDKANKAFRPVGVVEQPPLGAGELVMSAPLLPGQSTFAAEVTVAGKGSVSAGGPFVALSVLPTPGGEGEAMVVYPNGGGARLDLRAASIAAEPLSGLGAGSALVDLDGDGKAEVATSSPLFAPEGDELRVLDGSGKTVLWQSPVGRGQVMQAASVELEKGKARGLVLGVWTPDGGAELRLFRRASP